MIIFSRGISSRLEYVAAFVCQQAGLGNPMLTDDEQFFRSQPAPAINYSGRPIRDDEYRITPAGFLNENGVRAQVIECFDYNGGRAFFKTAGGHHAFDIFSAIFFLISRYEEYLPHEEDEYGRYAHYESLAWKEGFLDRPLVDEWLIDLADKCRAHFPGLTVQQRSFRFLPTYDIDEAFAYRNKPGWLNGAALALDLLRRNWKRAGERLSVITGRRKDPYDSFDKLNGWHEAFKLKPVYFFLLCATRGRYDKNISPRKKAIRQLVQKHQAKYDIGIHPSWQSGDDPVLMRRELETIQALAGRKVHASRQHFLRLSLPDTFRRLIHLGITHEYSMGYGSINGFRASTCSPFFWYDLERETATTLSIHSFCFMDANAFFEQGQDAGQAFESMMGYYEKVKRVNGELITLWHNTFLGTGKSFEGWAACYEEFLRKMGSASQDN